MQQREIQQSSEPQEQQSQQPKTVSADSTVAEIHRLLDHVSDLLAQSSLGPNNRFEVQMRALSDDLKGVYISFGPPIPPGATKICATCRRPY